MSWLKDWQYRNKLTLDSTKIPSNLSALRVPIFLNTGNFDFSKIKSNGEDFRFTDSDGVTFLDYEIEDLVPGITDGLEDSSGSPHTFSAQGDAIVTTADSKYGNASLSLDGTGDYVSAPDSTDWDLGTSDFCIEGWVKFSSVGTSNTLCARVSSGSSYFYFTFEGGTNLRFRDFNGTNNLDIQRTVSVTTGVWYHVAVTRSGTEFRIFLDGVQQGATVNSSASVIDRTAALDVGHMTANAAYALNGRIDEFRYSVGAARYTSNFTPTGPFTSDAFTKALLHFDTNVGDTEEAYLWVKVPTVSSSVDRDIYLYYGNAGASDAQDSPSVWDDFTAVWHMNQVLDGTTDELIDSTGNGHDGTGQGTKPTQVDGAIGYGLKGAGSGSYITSPDNDALDLTGDFEISWKMYWGGSVSNGSLFGKSEGGGGSPKWIINYGNLVAGAMAFHGGGSTVSWSWSPVADTLYHCRIKRTGNDFKFYVDGAQHGSTVTSAISVPNTTQNFHFFADGESWQWFSGRLDEVRLLNGSIWGDEYDTSEYYADSNQLLTYGAEEPNPTTPLFPALEWTSMGSFQLAPSLEWAVVQEVEQSPALEWTLDPNHKFTPNIVHYPLYWKTPIVADTTVPLTFTGCLAGATVYLKDTGSSGDTIIEIYSGGVLRETLTIPADGTTYTKIYHFVMNYLLDPLDTLEVKVTSVATGVDDLKVDLYQMTFPFDMDYMFFGNLQGNIQFSGIDKRFLFYNADYWFIEFNQPIKSISAVTIVDTNGDATDLDDLILETGFFYNNRVKFSPYTDAPIDHIRVRVEDYYNTFHLVNLYPLVSGSMANWPEFVSERIVSEDFGVTDLTTGKTASASNEAGGAASNAIDDAISYTAGDYWATSSTAGFPIHWAVDLVTAQLVRKLRLQPFENANGVYVKDFQIWGSNVASPTLGDLDDWDLLGEGTVKPDSSDFQDFEFDNDTAYRHYQITVISNHRGFEDAGIIELELYEGIDNYSSAWDVDLYIGASYYRVSYDNGSTFGDWVAVPDSQRIDIDFEGKITGTYQIVVEYQYGDNILSESFEVFYAAGELNALVQFYGETVELEYTDDVPFNRAEVYYDDELVITAAPLIVNGLGSAVTNSGSKTITIDPGTVYYQNEKYDFDGSAYTVQPNFDNYKTQFRVFFGFNTENPGFEFRELENETPGSPVLEEYQDFIIFWMFEYVVGNTGFGFANYNIYFSTPGIIDLPLATIPVELEEDRTITVYIYDVAERYVKRVLPFTKTKYNIWRTLTVTADPFYGSDYEGASVPERAIDNASSSFWTSPTAGPLPQWIRYDFGFDNPKTAVEYTIRVRTLDAMGIPTDWRLQGSNDGETWTDLDVVTGYSWAGDGPDTFSIDTPGAYTSYRLYIEDSTGGNYVQISEWELKESVGGSDVLDPDYAPEVLPGEIHGFPALDYTITSETWEDPL